MSHPSIDRGASTTQSRVLHSTRTDGARVAHIHTREERSHREMLPSSVVTLVILAAAADSTYATCSPGWSPAPASAEGAWADRCYRVEQGRTSLLECIEACAASAAVPLCISSASEASFIEDLTTASVDAPSDSQYVNDYERWRLMEGIWIGAYRVWDGDGTNDGTNAYHYKCVSGGALPFTDWDPDHDDQETALEPGHSPSLANASYIVDGVRDADSDCVMLLGAQNDGTPLARKLWRPHMCDKQQQFGGDGRAPCLCATNAGSATAESIAVLTRWSERDLAFRRVMTKNIYGLVFIIWGACLVAFFAGAFINRRGCSCKRTEESQSGRDTRSTKLRNARQAASQMRTRIKLGLIAIGSLLILVSASQIFNFFVVQLSPDNTPARSCLISCQPGPAAPPFSLLLGLLGPGVSLVMLAIFPTDVRTIRVCSYAIYFLFVVCCRMWTQFTLTSDQLKDQIIYGAGALGFFGSIVFLTRILVLDYCCPNEGCGCCTPLPPRLALRRLWLGWRTLIFILGATLGMFVPLALPRDPLALRSPVKLGVIFMVVQFWGSAFLMTPRVRGRIHRFLIELGGKGSVEQEASAIAALLGGGSADAALAEGTSRFRCISLSNVTQEDLVTSGDTGLFDKTKSATLGEVDAFLSHSWHDDAVSKYAALQDWGAAKTSPTIWLDKACIDQSNIEANLQALPVFLSGCKELMIVAGQTYSSRLWCVMEIFVFLKMGGTNDQIWLTDIGGDSVKNTLLSFDASKAKCFLAKDKERLFAVIESGYGDFVRFNATVQSIFNAERDAMVKQLV